MKYGGINAKRTNRDCDNLKTIKKFVSAQDRNPIPCFTLGRYLLTGSVRHLPQSEHFTLQRIYCIKDLALEFEESPQTSTTFLGLIQYKA